MLWGIKNLSKLARQSERPLHKTGKKRIRSRTECIINIKSAVELTQMLWGSDRRTEGFYLREINCSCALCTRPYMDTIGKRHMVYIMEKTNSCSQNGSPVLLNSKEDSDYTRCMEFKACDLTDPGLSGLKPRLIQWIVFALFFHRIFFSLDIFTHGSA